MNEFVGVSFEERVHRLALGIEPLEALRGGRLTHPVRIDIEGPPPRPPRRRSESYSATVSPGGRRARFSRYDSCLYTLLYQSSLEGRAGIDLRIYDHFRRYVPRRFRVPLLTPEVAESRPHTHRARRPVLFPGAAYDVSSRVTGLRGRTLRGGQPARWARVEARLESDNSLVGRAHGDDRGEFVLLLAPEAHPLGELADPLDVRVTVFGPATAPVPDSPELPRQDPLWDLPLEEVPPPGDPDPVSAGDVLPPGYVSSPTSSRIVPFRLGRLISTEVEDFVLS